MPAAEGSILAFRVLAVDQHIDGARRLVTQRGLHALEQVGGTQVQVQVKFAAHRQEQAMERDVIRHVGAADRSQKDCVVAGEFLPTVLRHHSSGLLVIGRTPGEPIPVQRTLVMPCRGGIRHSDGLIDHLGADPIPANYRDARSCHCKFFLGFL